METPKVLNSKTYAKNVLLTYGLGAVLLLLIALTPFTIPSVFRLVFGVPCPACGLTRAFLHALRLNFIQAMQMNILFAPIAIGALVYFVCAVLELFFDKKVFDRLNATLAKKRYTALGVLLMLASWGYNLYRWRLGYL